ncbi:MAG TPA: ABATE domain-containing protein [Steroidobacteraceae bacterium]|nr:ABATE domain-containing protein [Steroidobacteraceae bacterium]
MTPFPTPPAVLPPFDLSGGHVALDLVNSLDHRFGGEGPADRLERYGELLRFAEQTGLLDRAGARRLERSVDAGAGTRAVRSARELREALAATLYGRIDGRAPPAGALATLERCFQDAQRHRELRWRRTGGPAALEWQWGRAEDEAELPVWMVARAAEELLTSQGLERVRACDVPTCRWLFLDTSRNHSRRWCNMKVCGNRMKARRFQERRSGHSEH